MLHYSYPSYTYFYPGAQEENVRQREGEGGNPGAVESLDVLATAGGANRAVDLVYKNIQPQCGIIEVRSQGAVVAGCRTETVVQALAVPATGARTPLR
jgi:hypothetical protein